MVSIIRGVYQTGGKWFRSSSFEFSDTTRSDQRRADGWRTASSVLSPSRLECISFLNLPACVAGLCGRLPSNGLDPRFRPLTPTTVTAFTPYWVSPSRVPGYKGRIKCCYPLRME